jgi:hypothetical protein
MLPKEVRGIRFLEMHPQFFEPFIQSRINEALGESKKSEEFNLYEAQSDVLYNFEGKETRILKINEEPWVVARDVAEVLGYSEASLPARLFQSVPEEWKGVNPIHTLGGIQEMSCQLARELKHASFRTIGTEGG